jgi:hypothetical protein
MPKTRWWHELALEHLSPISLLAVVAFVLNTGPILPHDFWWHWAAGGEIVWSRRIPISDDCSYTMGGSAFNHFAAFWVAEVLHYAVFSLGGVARLCLCMRCL